jgi:hypothetical protein
MELNSATVVIAAVFENQTSGLRREGGEGQLPESDEQSVIVFLIVGKSTTILVLAKHRSCMPHSGCLGCDG